MFFRRKARPRIDAVIADHTRRVRDSGLFDADWYHATYPELAGFAAGALAHFCEYGLHEHRDPGPNFDTRRYLDAFPEAGTGPLPPFLHAIEADDGGTGRPAWLRDDEASLIYLIHRSGLFDKAWYRDTYPDVAKSGCDPLAHYREYGAAELRDPGPAFDTEHYALTYPHYRDTFSTPLVHYLRLGSRLGYQPTGLSRYERWLAENDDLAAADSERIAAEPVSIIVPVVLVAARNGFDGIPRFLEGLAEQIGAAWKVTLLRGPDMDSASWSSVVAQASSGPDIVCVETAEQALDGLADGDVVLLATPTTRLRRHACHAFAGALTHGAALAAYSDHDHLDRAGIRHAPVFKPAIQPVLLRQAPYAGAVVALRLTSATREALTLKLSALEASHPDWADCLPTLEPAHVIHIPLILYHVAVDAAVPPAPSNQPVLVHDASTAWPPYPRFRTEPSVRIVIPTRDRIALLRPCIDSILALTDYPAERYRIVIVDNGSMEHETARYFADVVEDARVSVVAAPGTFNFAAICNAGAKDADADIVVFLNNDTTVRQPNWLRRIAGYAALPGAGAVGARLLYPDETVQHGGVVLGIDGVGAHAGVHLPETVARNVDKTREIAAVTGACLAISRSAFEKLEGFDPLLRVDFNDVDLCCSAHKAGYRNIYVAEALLYHHESLSRGTLATPAKRARNLREGIRVRRRHAAMIRSDPFYNPNLSLEKIGALAVPPRVVPPWRRPPPSIRRVLLLSARDESGIDRWVADEAAFLAARGFEVILGGPDRQDGQARADHRRVLLQDPREAAIFATREGVDVVIAHSAPFFAVTRHLGRRPLVYCVDHGDRPAGMHVDRDLRADAMLDKRYHASLAHRVFATSPAARDALFGQETVLLPQNRPTEAAWSEAWARRRPELRETFGFDGHCVVVSLSMDAVDGETDSIADIVALATEYPFTEHARATPTLFVAAARGPVVHSAECIPADLVVLQSLSDTNLIELLASADLYLARSSRQGLDDGVALALAMGLPAVASAIEAGCAGPVETASDMPGLCGLIGAHSERWRSGVPDRTAVMVSDLDPFLVLADTIVTDLDRDSKDHWI